jgi:hypothetical protein
MPRESLTYVLARPAAERLFAPTRDRYGVRLALVFGNQAPGGQCPYYAAAKCRHCDIGAGEGAAFTTELNQQRLAWYREHYREILPQTAHLLLYNSGSLLVRREMPAELLDEILAWAGSHSALRVVSLESREGAVTTPSVRRVADALGLGKTARIVIGLESSNDLIRDKVLAKNMPLASVRRAVAAIGLAAQGFEQGRIGATFNILVGGPGTTAHTAVADALATATFALETGREAGVPIDLNLHPYYRSARSQKEFPDHPRCPVQTVASAARAVGELVVSTAPECGIFIGTFDEGHDQDPAPPDWSGGGAREAFARFNEFQEVSCLREI